MAEKKIQLKALFTCHSIVDKKKVKHIPGTKTELFFAKDQTEADRMIKAGVATIPLVAQTSGSTATPTDLEKEHKALIVELGELKEKFSISQADLGTANTTIESLNKDIDAAATDYTNAQAEITGLKATLAKANPK